MIFLAYSLDISEFVNDLMQSISALVVFFLGLIIISPALGALPNAIRNFLEHLLDSTFSFRINLDHFQDKNYKEIEKNTKGYFSRYKFTMNTMLGMIIAQIICSIYHYAFEPESNAMFNLGIILGLAAVMILLVNSIILRFKIMELVNKTVKSLMLPDDHVYTRIKCSPVHGVGVFAIQDMKKGTYVFLENCNVVKFNRKDLSLENKPAEIKRFYEDFCPKDEKEGLIYCPENFNFMTISWYMNRDEKNPNMMCDKNLDFYALRDIKAGEELLLNYDIAEKEFLQLNDIF